MHSKKMVLGFVKVKEPLVYFTMTIVVLPNIVKLESLFNAVKGRFVTGAY